MTGVIILAAGSSSRLGQAKQQLSYQGKSLLQHSIETALASKAEKVLVVLGANADRLRAQINYPTVTVVHNQNWEEGMASSIQTGLQALQEILPSVNHALFLLCDQPLVTPGLLQEMLQAKDQSNKAIIACAYANTVGAPVLFDASCFEELKQLRGQEGAKKVIIRRPDSVHAISFPEAALDIDTQADYQKLLQLAAHSK